MWFISTTNEPVQNLALLYASGNRTERSVCEGRGCCLRFRLYLQSNAVKLTHVVLHLLVCDTMELGCFITSSLAVRPDLVKKPVYSTAGSRKHPSASGIRARDLPLSRRTPYHQANEEVWVRGQWVSTVYRGDRVLTLSQHLGAGPGRHCGRRCTANTQPKIRSVLELYTHAVHSTDQQANNHPK